MFRIRLVMFLLLALSFLPGTVSADVGQYVILSAQYGTARNHVDVTQGLKELARTDQQFRMGNSTFGVDPDRGVVKTLRIYARGPDGRERMFEYVEGSVVDGSQFRSWGGGDWGNGGWSGNWNGGGGDGYVILSAQYGTARSHVDVTRRLRELARANLQFRMGNSTFGVDPDRGVVKTLRIYARGPDGRERMFEYVEGSVVDGSQFSGWGGGNWGNGGWSGNWNGGGGGGGGGYVILSAQYGTARSHVDVTQRLRELARTNQQFRMGNSTFGVDPDRGVVKTLRIYARGPDGRERMFEYVEGSFVDGAQFSGWGSGDWGNGGWSGRWDGSQ
jgi:hypothetical protein